MTETRIEQPETFNEAKRQAAPVDAIVLRSSRCTATLYCCDCLGLLPLASDTVVTDPPYGMNKADWDAMIPNWLPMVGDTPTATFCGVVGMRDYPTPDWVGAWVRQGSTQRNGKLRGFNNWEPILFYNVPSLANDVIAVPNYHDDYGHPSVKPDKLMVRLVDLMPEGSVLDPFMGTGTTGVACVRTGRNFIGVEKDEKYFNIAVERIRRELAQGRMF